MNVNANILVITTKMDVNETYVLSESENEIILPKIIVNDENKKVLTLSLNNKIMGILDVNEFELIPQITSHHYVLEEDNDENTINLIFSYLISYCEISNKKYSWFNFHWNKPNKNNELLYQTIQILR